MLLKEVYLTRIKTTNMTYKRNSSGSSQGSGIVYILGFIGAAVYYFEISSGFWPGVLAFLKALVWPAFLVYDVFSYIGGVQ